MSNVVPFPRRQNVAAVLPHKRGFEVVLIPRDGDWVPHGVFRTLSEAKAWAEIQAFRIGRCRVRVINSRGCA